MSSVPRDPRRRNLLDDLADVRTRLVNLERARRGYSWDPSTEAFSIPGDVDVSGDLTVDGTLTAPVDDTGWTALTKDAGWGAGTVNLRRREKIVVLDFAVTIGTTSSGTRLASIPAAERASVQIHGAGVSNSGGGVVVQIIVETDGDVMLYYPAGPGSGNALRGNVTWIID